LTEPVIDSHHHLWDLTARDQPWTAGLPALHRSFGFDELQHLLDRNGVASTVLVQAIAIVEETAELLAAAAKQSLIAGVVGWVPLEAPDVAEQLTSLRELPGGAVLVGIRHQVQEENDPEWLCRAEVRRGLAAVAAAGLAYDLLVRADQLAVAVEIARAMPDLPLVLDHGGNPPIDPDASALWQANVRQLASCHNVTVKLSGLLTRAYPAAVPNVVLRAWYEVLLSSFGPARIMFGSDWPVCTLAASYDDVLGTARKLTAELSADEQAQVFTATVSRAYRLAR
jgi:L-fuconolactonase